MPFDLNNTLWNYEQPKFQNVNIHKSLPDVPTNKAFNLPMGNSGKLYQAPVVYPNTNPKNAEYREQPLYNETMNPTLAHENALNESHLARHDARVNITGANVPFQKRIANMDIQFNPSPIYPMIAVAGLFGIAIILARMVK